MIMQHSLKSTWRICINPIQFNSVQFNSNLKPFINLLISFITDNRNRVKLAYIYGQKGSDYINASYIDVSISFMCTFDIKVIKYAE